MAVSARDDSKGMSVNHNQADLGLKHGLLTVLGFAPSYVRPSDGKRQTQWIVQCECGAVTVKLASNVRRGVTTSCGDRDKHPRVLPEQRHFPGVNTYKGAHLKMRRLHGPAKTHECVDCGYRADHWSYNGGDPDERWGVADTRRPDVLCAWSPKPEYYAPRCIVCHSNYDKKKRAERA